MIEFMIKFYKYVYGLSATIKKKGFTKTTIKYNLRNCSVTLLPNAETKKYSTVTAAQKAAQWVIKICYR